MSLVTPRARVLRAMQELIEALNEEYGWFNEEELKFTPYRVAKFFEEWYKMAKENEVENIKMFETTYDGIIIDDGIPVYGLCSHHLLPIIGTMTIAYVPGKDESGKRKVVGLSKLSRIAKRHMYRPMIQEEFTDNVLHDIIEEINPEFVFIRVEAQHDCKRIRGAKDLDSVMVTVRVWPLNENSRELEKKVIEYLKLVRRW